MAHGTPLRDAGPREAVASARDWRSAGDAYHAAGDETAGGWAYLRALAASTQDPELVAAATALNRSNLPAAERLLKERLKSAPKDIAAMRMLAELAVRIGRYGDAEALLDRALQLAPQFDAARFARALVLSRLSRIPEALADIDQLLVKSPDNHAYLNLRASSLVRVGEYEEACKIYRRVLAERPNEPRIWMSLGHVLKTTGQSEEGIEAYRRSLVGRPELGESWWSLANLKTYKFSDAEIETMHGALSSGSTTEEDALHLHFALGKALEDKGDYGASFEHYAKANATRRGQIQYDADETSALAARTRDIATSSFFSTRAGFGASARDPIFVVGLPRSGSTLVEQILASHPEIEGTMELPDLDKIARRLAAKGDNYPNVLASLTADQCRALGEEYVERTRIQRRLGRPLFIDKMPNNWRHVALIRLILPNAKIIDARRHPVACCFSAWKQHFARGQSFTYDLVEIARYYSDYVSLMEHFDDVLPGAVHRVIHERLVESPEAEIRRVLEYIGVPFDAQCLAFHENDRAVRTASSEQVRRPLSKDGLEQWRNFEPWLQPLLTQLGPVLDHWDRVQTLNASEGEGA
jgi:tetratricopeptide (TPR) repeat protein